MVRRLFKRPLLIVSGLVLLLGSGMSSANVEIIGAPVATTTIRHWGNQFTADTRIAVSYVEALEEVATSELFVGVYDLALVEHPLTENLLVEKGLVQFPLLGAPVAVVVNLRGCPPTLCDSMPRRWQQSIWARLLPGTIHVLQTSTHHFLSRQSR